MLAVVDSTVTLLSIFEVRVNRLYHVADISSRLLDVNNTSVFEFRSLDK